MAEPKRWGLIATLLLAAAAPPPPPPDVVLDCYVAQSGRSDLGQFVRHLVIRPKDALVVIADSIAGASPRWVGNARLVALDGAQIVYDFAAANSAGRTTIDRRTGAFNYADGRSAVRGTCQTSSLAPAR